MRYDKAMEQQRASFVVGEACSLREGSRVFLPERGEKGHPAAHCRIKKKTRRRQTWSVQEGAETQRRPRESHWKNHHCGYPLEDVVLLCVWRSRASRIIWVQNDKKSTKKSVTLESTKFLISRRQKSTGIGSLEEKKGMKTRNSTRLIS